MIQRPHAIKSCSGTQILPVILKPSCFPWLIVCFLYLKGDQFPGMYSIVF